MDTPNALATVNWLSIVLATIATFALGFLWYGPVFGKPWMRASGMTEERARQANMAKVFGLTFLLRLLAAITLDMFIGPDASLGFAVAAGAAVGVFWVATSMGTSYLFEQRPLALWLINAGYEIAAFTIMGAILGAW
jgi:hypothetical protein